MTDQPHNEPNENDDTQQPRDERRAAASPNPSPRPPIEPNDIDTPPPPPQQQAPYPYPYPHPQQQQPRGLLGNFSKLGALLSFGLVIFFAGFYFALFSFTARTGPTMSTYRTGETSDRVAIIPIDGVITSAQVGFVRRVVDRIVKDETIKAVIVRVESPGGGVTASDQILHHLKRLRQEKGSQFPIVGSYGSVAASGGYYVSCLCDPIYAEPTTITGSIGVIGQVFTFEKLLEEKLGVNTIVITSTNSPEKDTANNMFRTWTEKDKQVTQEMLDTMYDQFVDVIHENRKQIYPDRADVIKVADGRIYMAQQALDAKLVDEIGYLDAAIARAEKMGGIPEGKAPVVVFQQPPTFPSLFGMSGPGGEGSGDRGVPVGEIDATTIRRWMTELGVPEMMYMMQVAY